MPNCPCCGRAYAKLRSADKKLAEDRARAQAAIESLQIAVTRNYPNQWGFKPHAIESMRLELVRLQTALNDLPLLWSIYRRRDKASGYSTPSPMPVNSDSTDRRMEAVA